MKCKKNPIEYQNPIKMDIFKCDIYSLGLTLYETITGNYLDGLNDKQKFMVLIY